MTDKFHLRLPATSANIGPAFDTAAIAFDLHLDLTATPAGEFSISAKGRDPRACGSVEGNLTLETYRRVLVSEGRPVTPLRLEVNNGIPLGMGCGSSAAARLAGIALAVRFGGLGWRTEEIVAFATHLEGHPDNVSACWFGGMTVSAVSPVLSSSATPGNLCLAGNLPPVGVARFDIPQHWRPVVVLPRISLRTEESRKVLPDHYTRAATVANLQHTALLVAAFALGNSQLLQAAMHDQIHQPYRRSICPILDRLQDLAMAEGLREGVLGVALSGAGPGVLLIVEQSVEERRLDCLLRARLGSMQEVQVIHCRFENTGAVDSAGAFLPA